jgi:hypothetical protein
MRTSFTFLAVALLLFGIVPARAGTLDIMITDTTTEPGTAGQFEINLVNNSASAVTVGGFAVDVFLADITNVTFTQIDNATAAPYIFSITGGIGFVPSLLPEEASGNDLSSTPAGQLVNAGETWGLAHVRYLVMPGAPLGTIIPVTLEQFPVDSGFGTSLSDPSGAGVSFSGLGPNGTITVGTAAVPEPASFTMLTMAGIAVVAMRRFKTSRS